MAGRLRHGRPVHHPEADELLLESEEDVLHDRQVGDQGLLLENHADALFHRLAGVLEPDFPVLEQNLTAIGLVGAVDDLHQGGLAGPVLPDKADDLPLADLEIHRLEGVDAGKLLVDFLQLEHRLAPYLTNRMDLRLVDRTMAAITRIPSTPACR